MRFSRRQKWLTRSPQVRIEEASDEGEPTAPGRPGDDSAEPSHAASRRAQGAEWSFKPGHPSMIPPPLETSQLQSPPTCLIPFQLPYWLKHQSGTGPNPPGLRIPPFTEPPPRPFLDASASSPAVLSDRHPGLAMPVQEAIQHPRHGQYETPRRPPHEVKPGSHQSSQQARNESFYRQRPRRGPQLGEEQEQTPSRYGVSSHESVRQPRHSANLQSPSNRPFGPRSPRIWISTATDNRRAVPDSMAERLAQPGPTTSQRSRESMAGQHAGLQRSAQRYQPYRPRGETTRSHTVLIQEPELVNLVARRILETMPESPPPPYLLRGGRGHVELVPSLLKNGDMKFLQNTARKPVVIENTSDSMGRRSCRVRIVGNGRRPSDDSGYCTASSSTVPNSASLPQISDRRQEWWVAGSPLDLVGFPLSGRDSDSSSEYEPERWLAWSRAASRNLRRRTSAPSLGGQFRLFLEIQGDADDESSRPQSQGSGRENMGYLGILTDGTLRVRRKSG